MHCRLCKSLAFHQQFYKEGIPYCVCRQCGFTFSWPTQNANLSNAIEDFEPAYLDYLTEAPEEKANFTALLARITLQMGKPPKSVLDIGAGGGKWVRFLREQGIEAIGIEPSKALYDTFLRHESFFHHGFAEDIADEWKGKTFEAVTAFDVLEHLEDPAQLLRSLSSTLEPGGWLFASTPDVGSLLAKVLRSKWHYYNRYHLSYFNRETLYRSCFNENLVLKGFTHLGRLQSLGYVLDYIFHFVLKLRFFRCPRFFHRIFFPINLYDTFFAALQKRV